MSLEADAVVDEDANTESAWAGARHAHFGVPIPPTAAPTSSVTSATQAHADTSIGGEHDIASAKRRKDRSGGAGAGDDREHLAEMYRKEGSNLYKVNEFDRALDAFQKALSFAPSSSQWPMRPQVRVRRAWKPWSGGYMSVHTPQHPFFRCWATARRR